MKKLYLYHSQYGFGSLRFLHFLVKNPHLSCEFSTNPTPRDGNCLFHAILDGVQNNEAFRHTKDETNTWVELLERLNIYKEENVINGLRHRFVTGASNWLAGKYSSKLNDKALHGYSDNEWNYIWTTLLEDGAWAVPPIRDRHGNYLKENHAPELLLKFIAHDLQCNILILDLYNNTEEFCSGNLLLDHNVKFDSPLILYATGSHFQSVFPINHEYFIQYSLELQTKYLLHAPLSDVKGAVENHTDTDKNISEENYENLMTEKHDMSFAENIKQLESLTKIKAKERNTSERREVVSLRMRIFRHENEPNKEKETRNNRKRMQSTRADPEKRSYENKKQKQRMSELREDKEKKEVENKKQRDRMTAVRKDQERKETENKKQKDRMAAVRQDLEKKKAENEKQKNRMAALRQDQEKKNAENKKQKEKRSNIRKNPEKRKEENEKNKQAKRDSNSEKRQPFKNIAVITPQDKFDENSINPAITTSFIGNLFDQTNQCKHCKAFRYKTERNFCCSQGDVIVPSIPEPPEALEVLYGKKAFTDNLRAYNNILAMTSIGCNTPGEMMGPNFKILGKVYHQLGSLIPSEGEDPKFLQLYFYDTDEAQARRLKIMPKWNENILKTLTQIIEENNNYIKSFKTALELVKDSSELSLVLVADKNKIPVGEHSRRFNLPQGSEVAAIMPGEGEGELEVIVRDKDNKLSRISRIHRSYDPLSYVVFDPYGTDGFHIGLKRVKNTSRNVSLSDFYSYRIQVRPGFNTLLRSKRCFQQYLVDQGAKIEGMRMKWVNDHQKTIKAEKYNGLIDAAAVGDLAQVGRKIILPPSITGSPRFYVEKYQDCMAIVQKFGKPTLFITMTCNPEWREIQEALNPGETAFDRPDICSRVFKLKNDEMLDDIEKKQIFGKVKAFVGTIEQQKRKGLHHSHNLIILESEYVPKNPCDIDKIVSAEIPDPEKNPKLHKIISRNNMHGPCGKLNPKSPCMEKNENGVIYCTKEFPKEFQEQTTVTEYSYPKYKRRSPANGGRTIKKFVSGKSITLDNSHVVPYNSFLSLKFDTHINVELVTSVVSVKSSTNTLQRDQTGVLLLSRKKITLNQTIQNL